MGARRFLTLVAFCEVVTACAFSTGGMHVSRVGASCRNESVRNGRSAVVWVRASAPRDRALQSAWCETVGEPVVIPEPAARVVSGLSADALRVVSWNMNLGGGDLAALLREELGVTCDGSVPPPPFVLLVQEAYRRSAELPRVLPSPYVPRTLDPPFAGSTEDVAELAARCGLALVYVPSHRNGPDTGARPREDRGNAILSSLPLAAPSAVDLPFEAYRRVAAVAEVRLEGRAPLRVVSAHLDVSGLPFRMLLSGGQTRARQATGLVEALELLAGRGPPTSGTVVGADMNTWSAEESAVDIMRLALPASPPHDRLSTRGIFPADHIFFEAGRGSPSAQGYAVLTRSYGSDHQGRTLLLSWP